jgi:hypothetical protein
VIRPVADIRVDLDRLQKQYAIGMLTPAEYARGIDLANNDLCAIILLSSEEEG